MASRRTIKPFWVSYNIDIVRDGGELGNRTNLVDPQRFLPHTQVLEGTIYRTGLNSFGSAGGLSTLTVSTSGGGAVSAAFNIGQLNLTNLVKLNLSTTNLGNDFGFFTFQIDGEPMLTGAATVLLLIAQANCPPEDFRIL